MFFRNYIKSGPVLSRSYTYTFKLHELTLSYQVPYGIYGVVGNNGKNINYRKRPDKFKNDRGRNFYSLHSANFPYFYNRLIFSNFLPPEIGELRYEIGINKLSDENKIIGLEDHIPEFINNLLDGPTGINTRIRQRRSNDEDDRYLNSCLAIKPTKISKINYGYEWLNFTIGNYPNGQATHYYLFSLNDEYALSVEFAPRDRCRHKRVSKIVNETNEKAIQMIMSSIKLTANQPL